MRKGFTLIELLAVIIVLGVIIVIAVPAINNAIFRSADAIFVQSNNGVIRSFDNYISANRNNYMLSVGESIEVPFSRLVENNFMDQFISPIDKEECDGYVIYTRVSENDYSIMPITDCINRATSSEDAGLILYYSFNDFQEPTENIKNSNHPLNTQNHRWWRRADTTTTREEVSDFHVRVFGTQELDVSNGWYYYPRTITAANNEGSYYTFSAKLRIGSITNSGRGAVGFRNFGNEGYINYNTMTPGKIYNREHTAFIEAGAEVIPDIRTAYDLLRDGTGRVEVDWFDMQVEAKPYSTPFTEDYREGTVKNYVSNEYHVELDLETTPRWINESVNGLGSYYFNGENTIIDMSGLGLNLASTYTDGSTVSMWIKPESHSNPFARYMAGFHYWTINASGKLQNMVRNGEVNYWLRSDSTIPIDQWTHVTYKIIPGQSVSYYINGELDVIFESSDLSINNYSANSALGASYNNHFEGNIDDFMVFERALTSDEIKQLYLSSLR